MQRVSENELTYRDGDSGVKYMMRGPNIDWGVILVLPGQSLAAHYHEQVEETFYVVAGVADFVVNGQVTTAVVGDALRLEPQDHHEITNNGEMPLKLIFIKCPYLPTDKVNL